MSGRGRSYGPFWSPLLALLLAAAPAPAQTVTTGSLSGVVTDAQGGVLPGATVQAVHTPTGTKYETVTDAQGRYNILNVRVGPYDLSASMASFRDESQAGIDVKLGEQKAVDFQHAAGHRVGDGRSHGVHLADRQLAARHGRQRLAADGGEPADHLAQHHRHRAHVAVLQSDRPERGSAGVVGGGPEQPLQQRADRRRGEQRRVRPRAVRHAGRHDRGAADQPRRHPGAAAGRLAVRRAAGRLLRRRHQRHHPQRQQPSHGHGLLLRTRPEPGGREPDRHQNRASSAISSTARASADASSRTRRSSSATSTSGARTIRPASRSTVRASSSDASAEIDRFINILQTRYDYDPGTADEFIRTVNNDKVFIRTDFNIATQHQLTVRHNYVNALNDIGRPTTAAYYMPDAFYRMKNKTNSTVGQLNSTLGTMVNELRFTYSRIRDRRGASPIEDKPFPFVQVNLSSGTVRAGRENFSTANELDQDVFELNDDLTLLRGKHTFTIGTHNEFFKFRNLFIRDSFGNYQFNSLDLLEQGMAQSYDYSFSLTGDPQQSAKFRVRQFGFYVGDQWRPASNFTLTMGLRADIPTFPDKPTNNPQTEAAFGLSTAEVPSGIQWSPRVGFNYALSANNREQIRGGIGLFSGRTPYVWLSNQYGNTGIEFRRLTQGFNVNNRIPFVSDPNAQPQTVGGAATNEIDLIDPDYKYPSLIRTNIGYDRALGFLGLVGTAEFLYSKNVQDIRYENLNLVQTGTRPDGRAVYSRNRVAGLSDVIFLTNSDQGDAWSLAFKVDRAVRSGVFVSAGYIYGESRSIMDGTSSQAASNWGNVYVPSDPNNPPLTRSNFDPGHRITMSGGYDIPLGAGFNATASLFYSGQSGRPVLGELCVRLQRRRARHQRPALHPGERVGAVHLHQRHVQRPDDVGAVRAVPGRLHRQGPRAQRVPLALDQHVRLPPEPRAADSPSEGGADVGRAEPAQPVRSRERAAGVRQLQRLPGRAADDRHQRSGHLQPPEHRGQRRGADARAAVHAQRPAVPVADAVRRAGPLLVIARGHSTARIPSWGSGGFLYGSSNPRLQAPNPKGLPTSNFQANLPIAPFGR